LEKKLANLFAICGSAKDKKRIQDKIKNLRAAGERAKKKEKRMAQKASKEIASEYSELRPNLGLGELKIGANIIEFYKKLALVCEGDLDQQLTDLFNSCGSDRVSNKQIFDNLITYRSTTLDIWIETTPDGVIFSISTGRDCKFKGIELIGQSRATIESCFGAPDFDDVDSLGESLIYENIGLRVRINNSKIVEWVTVERIYSESP
jgi:hypothetical protein